MNSIEILEKCNLKKTKGRLVIIDVLTSCSRALSADYIYNAVKAEGLSINLSTIYRTLESLSEKGFVDKFDLGDGKYNYMLKVRGHKHILQCSLCHKELEIDCPMQHVEQILTNKTGFTSFEHELKIKGVCEECKIIK